MYSLDINLLSERPEYQSGREARPGAATNIAPSYGKTPLYIGAGAAVLALLGTGAGWVFLGQQTTQLEAKQKDLDLKLGSLKAQDARLADLNAETSKISGESQALAGIFNQVQPWSAVLQDLRESIPQGVQIANVSQSEKATTPAPVAPVSTTPSSGSKLIDKINNVPNPEATPKATPTPGASPIAATPAPGATPTATLPDDIPTTKLDIVGTAKSFEEVNNFILTLKRSAFFNPDDTQLLSAGLGASVAFSKIAPVTKASTKEPLVTDRSTRLELPRIVSYKIQTSLKRTPANDLIRELERKGAVGLVTRLKTLQQQQVLKP